MGLRDRKKEALRHRIIVATGDLIARRGLDATTVEDVAAAADVSVATVYNYFGTKSALVLAGVEEDAGRILDEGRSVLTAPGRDPRSAVKRLVAVYVTHLTSWDRRLLNEVMGAMFRPGAGDMAARLMQLDELSVIQLADLIRHFQDRGLVSAEVGAHGAAFLIYSSVATHVLMWLGVDDLDVHDLRARIDDQIDLAFTGLEPREV